MMRALVIVVALGQVARADGPRVAASDPPASPAAVATKAADAPVRPKGLAVGAEVGEPTSATVGWFAGALSIDAALGTGTLYGPGLSAHVDLQLVVARLEPAIPLRVGLGARYYNQHYQPASIDEVPSSNYGLRVPVALAYEHGSMQLYAEVTPGVDLKRTPSCNLLDGPNSICPHAQATPFFIDVVVGARWFLSH